MKRRAQWLRGVGVLLLAVAAGALCQAQEHWKTVPLLLNPTSSELSRHAPHLFKVRFETSKGVIVIEVHRDWSPHGADRFYNLVQSGYYDGDRFFRVIRGRWVQFGINGDPKIASAWRTQTIPDDPRRKSNIRGTIAFAFAVPNGRATQVYGNAYLKSHFPLLDYIKRAAVIE